MGYSSHCILKRQRNRLTPADRDLGGVAKSIDTIKFLAGGHIGRSYVRDSVEAVQLLHYKSFSSPCLGDDSKELESPTSSRYMDSAEVVIFYGLRDSQATGDVSQTILQRWFCKSPQQKVPILTGAFPEVNSSNMAQINKEEARVTLKNVRCTSWDQHEQLNDVDGLDVTFQFTDLEGIIPLYVEWPWL